LQIAKRVEVLLKKKFLLKDFEWKSSLNLF